MGGFSNAACFATSSVIRPSAEGRAEDERSMDAAEVKDLIDETHERERAKHKARHGSEHAQHPDGEEGGIGLKTSTAIYISVLAAVLAIVSVAGSNAGKELMASAIEASDSFAYYQAKTQRQISLRVAADEIELLSAGMPPEAQAKAVQRSAEYRLMADRMESDEGKNSRKDLLAKAKAAELRRDHAAAQDPYFDFAEGMLQLAIVLASVFAITNKGFILWVSRGLAAAGVLMAADGFTLILPLPFL
ncbi:hypothetical protein AZL_022580 [Azospirillum sp. B510]|nr:hypothetical protein AZL_022580 [Azospirillum sp. B510]